MVTAAREESQDMNGNIKISDDSNNKFQEKQSNRRQERNMYINASGHRGLPTVLKINTKKKRKGRNPNMITIDTDFR
jgi:hypothetical protein